MAGKKQKKTYVEQYPFDSAFRTLSTKCMGLTSSLLGEMFQVTLPEGTQMVRAPDDNMGAGGRRSTADSMTFIPEGNAGEKYLMECESTGNYAIRRKIAEYGVLDALANTADTDEVHSTGKIPRMGVLYLRGNGPDVLEYEFRHDGKVFVLPIHVLNMQDYTVEELMEGNNFFLLVFWLFLYEKELGTYAEDPEALYDIQRDIRKYIECSMESGILNTYDYCMILEMMMQVNNKLTEKYPDIREGLEEAMGGHVIYTETDRAVDYGKKQGKAEGLAEGKAEGKAEEKKETAARMMNMGFTRKEVMEVCDATASQLDSWFGSASGK